MNICNENGDPVNINFFEKDEQNLVNKYIKETDIVLELGARYGSVSCIINKRINYSENQVVVEPDTRVWEALERNKIANNCNFHIVKGFISRKKYSLTNTDNCHGYGTTAINDDMSSIPSFTLEDIQQMYGLKFNTLVADCEGFLETFFDENPTFYDQIYKIIFEADYGEKCNYNKIRNTLKLKGFKQIIGGFQNFWVKIH